MGFNIHTREHDSIITAAKIAENDKNRQLNLPVNRDKYNNRSTIFNIFDHYWDDFKDKYAHKLTRDAVLYNVNAMLNCGRRNLGYAFFECEKCDNFHLIHFTCKSRFCPKCNYKYSTARSINFSEKAIDANYRHIVFTIPDFIRIFFRKQRDSLNALFNAVNDTLKYICQDTKISKKRNDKFGFMLSLHTYGRDMKWNPHIHCLIAECKIGDDNIVRKFNYFHYKKLRKSFQRCLLKRLGEYFNYSFEFKRAVNKSYKQKTKGFYVYAPPLQVSDFDNSKEPVKELVKYITRYAAHPPIAESRIINVDYEKHEVRYYFEPHEDDQRNLKDKVGKIEVTEPVEIFIGKLLMHIPDFKFHNIRYYGFMSNASKNNTTKLRKLFNKKHINNIKNSLKYLYRLYECFKYDPILCPCGSYMTFNREFSYFGDG